MSEAIKNETTEMAVASGYSAIANMDFLAEAMVINPQVSAVQMAGGGSTDGGVSDGAVSSLLSGIREMLDGMGSQNPGMISIPVYLGNNLLDEVTADRLALLKKFLEMSTEEAEEMSNKAAESYKGKNAAVPQDFADYIVERDYVMSVLRTMKEMDADEEDWKKMVDEFVASKKGADQ